MTNRTKRGTIIWRDAHVSRETWNVLPASWPEVVVTSSGFIKEYPEGYIITHSVGASEEESVGQYICVPIGCVISIEYDKAPRRKRRDN